jgi:hypothetical protein
MYYLQAEGNPLQFNSCANGRISHDPKPQSSWLGYVQESSCQHIGTLPACLLLCGGLVSSFDHGVRRELFDPPFT